MLDATRKTIQTIDELIDTLESRDSGLMQKFEAAKRALGLWNDSQLPRLARYLFERIGQPAAGDVHNLITSLAQVRDGLQSRRAA